MDIKKIEKELIGNIGKEFRSYTYLIAVSGGRDSMTLLSVFYSLKLKIIVAHVNYQLRGEDSDLDEGLVSTYCKEHKIKLEVLKSDTNTYCEKHKLGIQEGARNIRYNWFEKLKKEHQSNYIVTAHHLDDAIETFFINLSRGSGVKGLKSIPYLHEGKLRPLIHYSRKDITDYALENKLVFRDDHSNNSNDYLRNKLRNKVIPVILAEIEGIENGISKSIDFLKMDAEFLYQQLEKETKKAIKHEGNSILVSNYALLPKRLIFHILQKYNFNYSQFFSIIKNGKSGNTFNSKNHVLIIERKDLIISSKSNKNNENQSTISSFGTHKINELTIEITKIKKPINLKTEPNTAYFSTSKLQFPLTLRNWKRGDAFLPYGMKGRKKISDFFIDQKIGVSEKSKIKILEYNGEIVWIIGFRTSDIFKVKSTCKEVIRIVTK